MAEKAYDVTKTPVQGLSVADLIAALQAFKGDDEATMRKRAEIEAEAHARLQKRENDPAPGVSAFNPKGDLANPRPELKCKMFWIGFPIDPRGLTHDELSLLNRIETVGQFSFTRTDGSLEALTIGGVKNANGQWDKITVDFDAKGDKRHNLPPMVTILREVLGVEDEITAKLKRLAELEALVA